MEKFTSDDHRPLWEVLGWKSEKQCLLAVRYPLNTMEIVRRIAKYHEIKE